MFELGDDDPKPRPPPKHVDDETMTARVIADEVAKRLQGCGGRIHEVAERVPVVDARAAQVAAQRPVEAPKPVAPPMPNEEVIHLVRRLSGGMKYVSVEKVVEALS